MNIKPGRLVHSCLARQRKKKKLREASHARHLIGNLCGNLHVCVQWAEECQHDVLHHLHPELLHEALQSVLGPHDWPHPGGHLHLPPLLSIRVLAGRGAFQGAIFFIFFIVFSYFRILG